MNRGREDRDEEYFKVREGGRSEKEVAVVVDWVKFGKNNFLEKSGRRI